jgi:hypothetical protein
MRRLTNELYTLLRANLGEADKLAGQLYERTLDQIDAGIREAVPVASVEKTRERAQEILKPQPKSDEREKLAAWMIENSFATGHGDSLEDLLGELTWQVKEMRDRAQEAREAALEEAAQVVDQCNREGPYNAICSAERIRALSKAAEGED